MVLKVMDSVTLLLTKQPVVSVQYHDNTAAHCPQVKSNSWLSSTLETVTKHGETILILPRHPSHTTPGSTPIAQRDILLRTPITRRHKVPTLDRTAKRPMLNND